MVSKAADRSRGQRQASFLWTNSSDEVVVDVYKRKRDVSVEWCRR